MSKQLKIISESDESTLKLFNQGHWILRSTGNGLAQMKNEVVRDRMLFAATFIPQARQAYDDDDYRLVVNRCYYSMYHCFRAVVYHFYDGDDHQKHRKLPQKIPDTFPQQEIWSHRLRQLRVQRNEAGYCPYDTEQLDLRPSTMESHIDHAEDAIQIARKILGQRGVYDK